MLEIDGPMCYKITAEYYMHIIFWVISKSKLWVLKRYV
jgi:hypothetical protein